MDAMMPSNADPRPYPIDLRTHADHASKMRESTDISQIAFALVRAQGAMTNPPRNRTVEVRTRTGGTYTFRYATLDEITKTTRQALAENGLCVLQPVVSTERGPVLVTRLLHESGQWMECEVRMPPIAEDPQAFGSVITYLRRHSISAMLNICPDEDDDANSAAGNHVQDITPRKGGSNRGNGQDTRQKGERVRALTDDHARASDPVQALTSRASVAESVEDGQALLEAWQREAANLEQYRGGKAWEALERELGTGLKRSLGVKPAVAFIAALRAIDAEQIAAVQQHWDGKWAETLSAMQQKAPAIHALLRQHVTAQATRVRGLTGNAPAFEAQLRDETGKLASDPFTDPRLRPSVRPRLAGHRGASGPGPAQRQGAFRSHQARRRQRRAERLASGGQGCPAARPQRGRW